MKVLVDMNLSPRWVDLLTGEGVEAAHWSTLGSGNAPDRVIMAYAKTNDYIVLTHDLLRNLPEGRENEPRVQRGRCHLCH